MNSKHIKVGEYMVGRKYELAKAFPSELEEDVLRVLSMMTQTNKIDVSSCFEVHFKGSRLRIPERMYNNEFSLSHYQSLTDRQQLVVDCLFTRHHDGFIREKYLKKIIHQCSDVNGWILPYIIRLTGEYVIEILHVIKENVGHIDKDTIKEFITENPRFYQTIKSRVVSYWDCYYRREYPAKTDYVGFEIIEYFGS
ncbi:MULTISPECIES: hypothetical protein [unclassified Peribacillus]|uniref:hypothetical protein n=1 Tax=unclassified Peribacillus TaxID=2675266 RepID=UPI0037FB8DCE